MLLLLLLYVLVVVVVVVVVLLLLVLLVLLLLLQYYFTMLVLEDADNMRVSPCPRLTMGARLVGWEPDLLARSQICWLRPRPVS